MSELVEIDGSQGEGGGQILRTSLSLSMITGQPFRLFNVRTRRPRPGLLRQHLTAVRAAKDVCNANVKGAELHSQDVLFHPGPIRSGHFEFDIGSAGSTTLILQTLLPALMQAPNACSVVLSGGTHNEFAPPFDFLQKTFVSLLNQMGGNIELHLDRYGFYPVGKGRLRMNVQPSVKPLSELELVEPAVKPVLKTTVVLSQIPEPVGEREMSKLARTLNILPKNRTIIADAPSDGPGNVILVHVEQDQLTETFTGFGRRGLPAEKVAQRVAREVKQFLAAGHPVGPYLTDQLLIPLALNRGGRFRTGELTQHTRTNIETVQRFLDVDIATIEIDSAGVEVSITPKSN